MMDYGKLTNINHWKELMEKWAVVRRRLKKPLIAYLIVVIFASAFGLWNVVTPVPYLSLAPFRGRVVDARTNKPIAGAVVLAEYDMTIYMILPFTNSITVGGQETLTDDNGEFRLPRKRRWLRLRRGYPEGSLKIYMPGYGHFPKHLKSEAVGVNKSWPPPNKYIVYKLPKTNSYKERLKALDQASVPDEDPYRYMKFYNKMISQERKFFGFKP